MLTLFSIFNTFIKLKHKKYPSYAQRKAAFAIIKETAIQEDQQKRVENMTKDTKDHYFCGHLMYG